MKGGIMNFSMRWAKPKFLKRSIFGCSAIFGSGLLVVLLFANSAYCSYNSVRRHVTESARLYNLKQMEAQLIWKATYFSDSFRRAYEKRHIALNHLGPVEAARWIAEQEKQQGLYHEFFIDFYSQKEYRDFSLAATSFWQMVLTTEEGSELQPTKIEEITLTPYERKMFPSLNRWSRGYRVLFPKVTLGKSTTLTLRSVVGKSDLTWKHLR